MAICCCGHGVSDHTGRGACRFWRRCDCSGYQKTPDEPDKTGPHKTETDLQIEALREAGRYVIWTHTEPLERVIKRLEVCSDCAYCFNKLRINQGGG